MATLVPQISTLLPKRIKTCTFVVPVVEEGRLAVALRLSLVVAVVLLGVLASGCELSPRKVCNANCLNGNPEAIESEAI